ncbi:MAG: rRNA maturation RNase YbeY [Acidimicrobiia bacterium]|nr:rRNA maturation RNase YbeY [Acidimicrobiia bacterium]MDH5291345.1 rRNA maturation RNase YbeY [Acidimicrobiia bacterium]
MSSPRRLEVEAHDETDGESIDLARWQEVAHSTLAFELDDAAAGRLDLIFVDPDTMAELNREHLGADYATDVLAFPLDAADDDLDLVFPAGGAGDGHGAPVRHLGDVVVCPQVARAQAGGHCGPEEAELTLLVVHGVLHVLGHDHAEDDERLVMQGRERLHLGRYGYAHPVRA